MSDPLRPGHNVLEGSTPEDVVFAYHERTKHHPHRFAASPGFMDWATQPDPFRRYQGAPLIHLPLPEPGRALSYWQLYVPGAVAPAPLSIGSVSLFLRYALSLTAWKRFGGETWSLRANPSSGNLHPTEGYAVLPALDGIHDGPAVHHYAPKEHGLERRADLDPGAWSALMAGFAPGSFLVGLSSIPWREAWKYGERAFRYCQHDLGHAIAALVFAAANESLSARLLPEWSHRDIAALTGIDRDDDFVEAEREEPGCLLVLGPSSLVSGPSLVFGPSALLEKARGGAWAGHASRLSEDHVQWTFIDEVARATEDAGRPSPSSVRLSPLDSAHGDPEALEGSKGEPYPPKLILQRRSALALDGRSSISADAFFAMLARAVPSDAQPWSALWWTPRIHLALFVHRVDGLEPGLYLLPRSEHVIDRLRAACRREFAWNAVTSELPLVALAYGDCRRLSARVSCDQDIAADGFFSLGMIADFDASLRQLGSSFYRHLFWESGVVGQVLYLEAEAAGARGTGIGCFYDDPMHEVLGLADHGFQSLYHFTIGMPVEDTRLTTEPGYDWGC
jgi:SagB-type dehydrogenase family enzyme